MASAPQYYKAVDLGSLQFEPLTKLNKLYVANLAAPLSVQTPPVELATGLGEGDFACIKPSGQFLQWLRDVEDAILERAVQNKADWFRKELSTDVLRHNFKSFFRDDGQFKVRTDGDVPVFDAQKNAVGSEEAAPGTSVRCVLELVRVCFGRQEFGAMWRLVQARLVDPQPCLIDDAAEVDDDVPVPVSDDDGGEADVDEQEFL